MHIEAQGIFDYLPIEAGSENLYIQHLWGAFNVINSQEEPVRAFTILPFHLLFMLAVQYKVYRISAWNNKGYLSKLESCGRLNKENRNTLRVNAPIIGINGIISTNSSVRNLSYLPERELFSFFQLVNLNINTIDKATELIEIRGRYAHANGYIEENIDERLSSYLEVLDAVQLCMAEVNVDSQDWVNEVEKGEFPLDDFFSERFLRSQFSPRDFGDVVGQLLQGENLEIGQWSHIANLGMEKAMPQTVVVLQQFALTSKNVDKRLRAVVTLNQNSAIDEQLKEQIVKSENNEVILNLLR